FEFYINFGTVGVIVGFLLLGMALRHLDDRLISAIYRSDWSDVACWFIVGSCGLQVGGSLAEIVASMMAAALLTLLSRSILPNRRATLLAGKGGDRWRDARGNG